VKSDFVKRKRNIDDHGRRGGRKKGKKDQAGSDSNLRNCHIKLIGGGVATGRGKGGKGEKGGRVNLRR